MSVFKERIRNELEILKNGIFKITMYRVDSNNLKILDLYKKLDDLNTKFNLLLDHLGISIEEKSKEEKEKDNIPYKIKVKGD